MISFSALFLQALILSHLIYDPVDTKELLCLSEAIYYESGSEELQGKVAVGSVILNRTKHDSFPNTVCSVVAQPKQFSYKDSSRYRSRMVHRSEYDEIFDSLAIAHSMLKYGNTSDPTHGSLYFLNTNISKNQAWTRGLIKTVKIDQHTFFRRTHEK